jgi:hypothetical protein
LPPRVALLSCVPACSWNEFLKRIEDRSEV